MTDPKTIERIMDAIYEPAEVCNCEEPCESEAIHQRRVWDAYEDQGDKDFERRREEGLL